MTIDVRLQRPSPVVIHIETVAMIERVVSDRYESVYNQNQAEIETELPPKTTM